MSLAALRWLKLARVVVFCLMVAILYGLITGSHG